MESRGRRDRAGFIHHSVPRDDAGRRALQQYDLLWIVKRGFPQWHAGDLSVGFRRLIAPRTLPEDAQNDYRKVKQTVLATLKLNPDWTYIPAEGE